MASYLTQKRDYERELELVDHPAGLTPLELAFCREYALGGKPYEAYRSAVGKFEGRALTEQQLRARGFALLRKPAVRAYLSALLKHVEALGVMSLTELLVWLSDGVRTPIDAVDATHPLCQKRKITRRFGKTGEQTGETEEIEMVSKLECARMLANVHGWNAPTQIDVNHKGGVMVVPMATNPDEWERAALASQEELMRDAIDI